MLLLTTTVPFFNKDIKLLFGEKKIERIKKNREQPIKTYSSIFIFLAISIILAILQSLGISFCLLLAIFDKYLQL